jgi:hypothetical protein
LTGNLGRILLFPLIDVPVFVQLVLRFVDDPFDEVSNNRAILTE